MRTAKEELEILFDNACNDKEGFIPLMNECYSVIKNDLDFIDMLYNKMNEYEKKEPYRTTVTIRIGFDDLDEYERFEKWLESKRRKE